MKLLFYFISAVVAYFIFVENAMFQWCNPTFKFNELRQGIYQWENIIQCLTSQMFTMWNVVILVSAVGSLLRVSDWGKGNVHQMYPGFYLWVWVWGGGSTAALHWIFLSGVAENCYLCGSRFNVSRKCRCCSVIRTTLDHLLPTI